MIGYFELFPDKQLTELRTAVFLEDCDSPFPAGTYLFTEHFCSDTTCNCQRTLIKVLYCATPQSTPVQVAGISYTWNECPDDSWRDILLDTPNPHLDPLHPQATYASELMDFWFGESTCERAMYPSADRTSPDALTICVLEWNSVAT